MQYYEIRAYENAWDVPSYSDSYVVLATFVCDVKSDIKDAIDYMYELFWRYSEIYKKFEIWSNANSLGDWRLLISFVDHFVPVLDASEAWIPQ